MDVNKITTKLTKSLGSIAVIKPILDKLEIAEVIDKYSSMNRATGLTNGMTIEIAIINRLMAPKPCTRWRIGLRMLLSRKSMTFL